MITEREKGGMLSLFEHGWNTADIASLYELDESHVWRALTEARKSRGERK